MRTPKTWSTSRSGSTSGWSGGGDFDAELVEELPGLCILRVLGKGASEIFSGESGGHRWQRVPPTEKRGRVHSSTITVAVLGEPSNKQVQLREPELEWSTCRGSGAGGQHRNKTESAVVLKHLPSGLTVRCESERSQHANRATALSVLRARLWEAEKNRSSRERARDRKIQVGSGERGDKRRTVAVQRDEVVDHETGRRWRFSDYERGLWE